MILRFKYGFDYKGIPYGWLKGKLYRLPYNSKDKRSYPLKELESILIGNKVGYRVGRDKKTIEQLEVLTNRINFEYNKIVDSDCPF